MVVAYIGLGGNLGDPEGAIQDALRRLGTHPAIKILKTARYYRTEPVEMTEEGESPWFTNTVTQIETSLEAQDLLSIMLGIEQVLGRVRPEGGGVCSRTIDLDLLFYGNEIIRQADLQIPHPRLHTRSFVLSPMLELDPGFYHPVLGQTIRQLHLHCSPDTSILCQTPA